MAQRLSTYKNLLPFQASTSFQHIFITHMQEQRVRNLLAQLNLNIDLDVMNNILNIVKQPKSYRIQTPLDDLTIYAIAAITAQTKRLLALDNHTHVQAGIPIERLMMRLPHQNRLNLIRRIDQLSHAQIDSFPSFRSRLDEIESSYKQFLRAKEAVLRFEQSIFLGVCKVFGLVQSHFKILWLLYLQIRQKNIYNNQCKKDQLLVLLINFFFTEYLHKLKRFEIYPILVDVFGEQNTKRGFSLSLNKEMVHNQFLEILQRRSNLFNKNLGQSNLLNLQKSQRFLDDFHNKITNKYAYIFGFQKVDETLYLEIDKTMTPMPFCSNFSINKHEKQEVGISKRINLFDDSDNDDNEKQELYTACGKGFLDKFSENNCKYTKQDLDFKGYKKEDFTEEMEVEQKSQIEDETIKAKNIDRQIPSLKRLTALNWMHKTTKSCKLNHKLQKQFQQFFDYSYFEFKKRFQILIQKYLTSELQVQIDISGRIKKIFNLFEHFMNIMVGEDNIEKLNVLGINGQISSFLWLSTLIINYICRSSSISLNKSIEVFGISSSQAFFPINWIGKNIKDLPQVLKYYLFGIQKHILLTTIWQKQYGYELMTKLKNQKLTYLHYCLRRRLYKQVINRAEQMSRNSSQLILRVKDIIKNHHEILKYNSMNTVILLALASLRKSNLQQNINVIIQKWRQIPRYFDEELIVKDEQGNKISFFNILFKYYPYIQYVTPYSSKITKCTEARRKKSESNSIKELSTSFSTKLKMGDELSFAEASNLNSCKLESQSNENLLSKVSKGIGRLSIKE